MAIRISRSDPRYAMLQRSRNLRWNGNEAEGAAEIELCETAEQAAEALQRWSTPASAPPFAAAATAMKISWSTIRAVRSWI